MTAKMLCTTSPHLRALAVRNSGLQSVLVASHSHRASSTKHRSRAIPLETIRRHNSTTTSSSIPQNPAAGVRPPEAPLTLTWNEFLRLRKERRRYNLACSVGTSLVSTAAGITILASQDIDPVGGQLFGMDPYIVLGLATFGFSVAGWLAGPVLGNLIFNLVRKKYRNLIAAKEKAFFEHIKKNRVDPSFQSVNNPVPDYYGEKIGSVQQYRQWLRDQRAYIRKSREFL